MTNAVTNDIRDIKPPLEIPNGWAWLWWTLGTVAALAILFLVFRWWQKQRAQISIAPPIPAHVRAKQKLEEALALISQPKEFCVLVSDTVRFYLEERFDFRAPERTTEEFLRELNATDLLLREQKESLGKFLQNCDLVKFAKYEPGEPELRELYSSAMHLIDETSDIEIPQAATTTRVGLQKGNATPPPLPNAAKGRIFAITGALLQIGPVIWLVFFIRAVIRLVAAVQGLPGGVNSDEFHTMLQAEVQKFSGLLSWFVWLAALVGLGLMMVALLSLYYRAKWFFWFVVVYGVLILWAIPLGTAGGIFYLVYAWQHRREFSRPVPPDLKQ